MSEGESQRGWWRASDGNWYPPELHPEASPALSNSEPPLSNGTPWATARPDPHEKPSSSQTADDKPQALEASVPNSRRRVRPLAVVFGVVASLAVLAVAVPTTAHQLGSAPRTHKVVEPSTSPQQPPPLILPSVEQNVIRTTWTRFSNAVATGNLAAIRQLSTVEVQEEELGGLNCGCSNWPTAYTAVSYSSVPETSYPISFLAEFQGGTDDTGAPFTKEVMFSQVSAGAPWLVSHLSGFADGHPLFDPSVGLNQAPPPLPHSLTAAPEAYAEFFQQLDSTGTTNKPLPTNYSRDNMISSTIADALRNRSELEAAGLTSTYTHVVDGVSPVFGLKSEGLDYGAELCFNLQEYDTITASAGAVIAQPADRSNWGALLEPGFYSALRVHTEFDVCLYEPIDGHLYVSTVFGGSYHFSGTRVRGMPIPSTDGSGVSLV